MARLMAIYWALLTVVVMAHHFVTKMDRPKEAVMDRLMVKC